MSDMTMHDRMMAVYRHEVPDQMPVSIYTRYLPRGWTERMIRNIGLGIVEYYPVTTLLAPPWHTYSGFVSQVQGVDFTIRYSWEEGEMIENRIYETPVGKLHQTTVTDPTYGSDWIQKFYIESLEDYKIMQYVVEHTVFLRNPNEDILRQRKEDLGDDGVLWGRIDRCPYQKLLIELAGPQRFLLDLYTTPEPVVELMAAMQARLDEAFLMALDSAAEVIWQPDNLTADMTPPDAYAKYFAPQYALRARHLKDAGKPYLVHLDGRLKALKALIAESPFDAVESFSLPQIGGDLTLSEARAAWPDKVILANFPANLSFEDDARIEAFLDDILREAGRDKPFMLQLSEDIPHYEWKRVLPMLCRAVAARGR